MNLVELLQLKYPDKSPILDYQVFDNREKGKLEISYWGDTMPDPQPNDTQIASWSIEFDLAHRQEQARALRAQAYPSLEDQLDMQFHDKRDGTNVWESTIEAIKAQYPIPTE